MAQRSKERPKEGKLPEAEIFTLTSLDQVKTLSDPLRIRLLESFICERTTKQVAELIGERPTRLYHHVDSLERAGLIRLVRTRQNRGTVEKYYQAVARTFRADPAIFGPEAAGKHAGAVSKMVSTILDTTALEMKRLVSTKCGPRDLQESGLVSFVELRASEKRLLELRERLETLVKKHSASRKPAGAAGVRRYRLMLAFYPLDRGDDPGE